MNTLVRILACLPLTTAWPAQPAGDPGLTESAITIVSPMDYQVVQRRTRLIGTIPLSGRAPAGADAIEMRLTGTPAEGALDPNWRRVPLAGGRFNADAMTPAGGWYVLEVRALKGGAELATAAVAHVGVGEVFVGAGQSNSTNSGGEGVLKTRSGMVSTFGGTSWRLADDPQPGVHDNSQGGSFWPAFGDAMYERLRVPIGVAVTGHGGTSINQWQSGGELFNWMEARVQRLGRNGFRALLWHQGESDVGMTSDQYAAGLAKIIRDSTGAAGWEFPWFVARVSYHNPGAPSFDSTRNAQKSLWDAGVALEGPDTDTLGGDNRDGGGQGIHFSPKGLEAHGRMWADKVGVYVERVLAAEAAR